jgi:tetratricopeptide (TPR) repeat protein
VETSEQLKHDHPAKWGENVISAALAHLGRRGSARDTLQGVLSASELSANTEMAGFVLISIGLSYSLEGEYDLALTSLQRALSHFEHIGDITGLAVLHHQIGMIHLQKGDINSAHREFNRTSNLGTRGGNRIALGLAGLGKARAFLHSNDLKLAMKLVNQSLEHFAATDEPALLADAYTVKGMINSEIGRYEYAWSYLETSLALSKRINHTLNLGEAYFELGKLGRKMGKKTESRGAYLKAIEQYRAIGAHPLALRAEEELGRFRLQRSVT